MATPLLSLDWKHHSLRWLARRGDPTLNPMLQDIVAADHRWDLAVFESAQAPRALRSATLLEEDKGLAASVDGQRLGLIGYVARVQPNEPVEGAFEIEGLPADEPGGVGRTEQIVHALPAGTAVCPICRGRPWFDPTRASEPENRVLGTWECPAAAIHAE